MATFSTVCIVFHRCHAVGRQARRYHDAVWGNLDVVWCSLGFPHGLCVYRGKALEGWGVVWACLGLLTLMYYVCLDGRRWRVVWDCLGAGYPHGLCVCRWKALEGCAAFGDCLGVVGGCLGVVWCHLGVVWCCLGVVYPNGIGVCRRKALDGWGLFGVV